MNRNGENLSDARGTRLGSAILRGILTVFGPAAACFIVRWFIAPVYALTSSQKQRDTAEQRCRWSGP